MYIAVFVHRKTKYFINFADYVISCYIIKTDFNLKLIELPGFPFHLDS